MIIRIKNPSVNGIIGVEDQERTAPRQLIVNVELHANASAAAAADDIDKAVDYAEIAERISSLVSESSFRLLEALADAILKEILTDRRVEYVSVEVDKPGALEASESVSVTVSSGKKE